MAIYRVFSDADGESHIEDLKLEEHPELGAMINVSEVRVQEFDGSRHRDFNPLPDAQVDHPPVWRGGDRGQRRRETGAAAVRGYPADGGRYRQGPFAQRPDPIGRGIRPAERLNMTG